jgi:hypothetical protein
MLPAGDRPVASLRRANAACLAAAGRSACARITIPCHRRSAPAAARDAAWQETHPRLRGPPAGCSTWRLPMAIPLARLMAAAVDSSEPCADSVAATSSISACRVSAPGQSLRKGRSPSPSATPAKAAASIRPRPTHLCRVGDRLSHDLPSSPGTGKNICDSAGCPGWPQAVAEQRQDALDLGYRHPARVSP